MIPVCVHRMTTLWKALEEWFFSGPESNSRSNSLLNRSLLLVCWVAGALHWVGFFHGGKLEYTAHDWPKEIAHLQVMRDAIRDTTLPYHTDSGFQGPGSESYLALPETVLSPQVLLLAWIQPESFVLVNVLILFTLSLGGCVLLWRQLGLTPFAFLALFLLFQFNGYLTARMAVGHYMWSGCFFLPFFVWSVLRSPGGWQRHGALTALIATAMLLQGAFHLWIWCMMFLVFLALGSPEHRRSAALAVLLAGAMATFRMLPAALCLADRHNRYLSGYPTLASLFEALIVMRTPDHPVSGACFGELGWWEYDLYVGLGGAALLFWFGVWRALVVEGNSGGARALRTPVFSLTLLSMVDLWAIVAFAPIPFAAVERVSSRFIILPFVFVLAIGCRALGRTAVKWNSWARIGALALLLVTSMEMLQHSIKWRPWEMERQIQSGKLSAVFSQRSDPALQIIEAGGRDYRTLLWGSCLVSLAGLAVAVLMLRKPSDESQSR